MNLSSLPLSIKHDSRGSITGFRLADTINVSNIQVSSLSSLDSDTIYIAPGVKVIADTVSATEYQGGGLVAGDAYFSSLADGPGNYGDLGQFIISDGSNIIFSGYLSSLTTHIENVSNPHNTALSSLTDVSSNINPSTNQVFVWNGNVWTASTISVVGGTGANNFLELNDTSSTYLGAADKILIVSPNEDKINFEDLSYFDHGGLSNVGVSSHTQLENKINSIETSTVNLSAYIAANEATWETGGVSDFSSLDDVNITSPVAGQTVQWNGTKWVNITPGEGVTDHGLLTGLSDNDHPQYVLSSTNNNLSSLVTNIQTSTINLSAYIAANESAWSEDTVITDHGALTGLGDNDHPQYVLSSTNNNLSSLVANIQTSTVNLSSYISSRESAWSTNTSSLSSLDDTNITGVISGQTLQWNGTKWVNITPGEGVTDHGLLTGLSDNDHPQYVLSSTNNNLSSLVTNIQTSTVNLSAYIAANESSWLEDNDTDALSSLTDTTISSPIASQVLSWNGTSWVNATPDSGVTDHGLLTGLSDNDHPQYVLSSTNSNLSSLVTNIQTSTVNLSAYIAANESAWAAGGVDALADLTDVTITTPAENEVLTFNGEKWVNQTPEAPPTPDHGTLLGLSDDDHTQYIKVDGTRAFSGRVSGVDPVNIADLATAGWVLANFPLALNYDAHIAAVNPHKTALSSLSDASTVSPSTNQGLIWNGSAWVASSVLFDGSGTVTPSAFVLEFDDFDKGILGTGTNNVNTGASYSYNVGYNTALQSTNNNCQGILVTTNGGTTTRGNAGGSRYQGDPYTYMWRNVRFYFRVAYSASSNVWFRFGLSRETVGGTSNPVSACYFESDTSIGTNISGCVSFSGTTTRVDTGISNNDVLNSFRWFAIENTSSGIDFLDCGSDRWPNLSRNITPVGNISSPVPPYPGHQSGVRWWTQAISNGSNTVNLLVDCIAYDKVIRSS